MNRRLWIGCLTLLLLAHPHAGAQETPAKVDKNPAVERGRLAVRGRPAMNPALWSTPTLDQAWKQWGLKERPKDYAPSFRARYGLHPASYDNQDLPMGLHEAKGLFGKGVGTDCLLCHAGRVAGQTVVGLGNSSLDLQGLFDDLFAAEALDYKFPIYFSHVRGTIDAINPVTFLLEFRAPDLSYLPMKAKLDYVDNIASDPPAWWLLKRKTTRNWTGSIDAGSVRVDMVNLLTPFNSAEHVKKHESVFADIHAFIMSVEAPKYPFPIDLKLAEKGRPLFNDHCARCHGTYGAEAKYPNKIVPFKTLGTDPVLATALTPKNLDYFNRSWFAQEKGPDGKPRLAVGHHGYQSPPLDGIWATAPYLHNASVPTLYHLLNSKERPTYFTRSYRGEVEDYDQEKGGLKITVLEEPPGSKMSGHERRKIYDATLPGRTNVGHTFGDAFTEEERRAVIEYLKTL